MLTIIRAALLASVLLLAGCIDGKLTPAGAAIVKALDLTACSVLEATLPSAPGKVVGAVCEADKPLLDVVLGLLTGPKLATLGARSATPRPVVRCGGRAIAHLDAALAADAQALLDARPECAGR